MLPNKNVKTENSELNNSNDKVGLLNNPSNTSNMLKMPKIPKVPAIQDHGYMKQECLVQMETGTDSTNSLGILTPASSPPLLNSNFSRIVEPASQQMKTLHKYLTADSSQIHQMNIMRCKK